MKKSILIKCLFVGIVSSVGALADITVDKSNALLTITSDIGGTVIAKIIGPNDEVVVNTRYEGNSFTWSPSGADGAYRYDVRVVPTVKESISDSTEQIETKQNQAPKSDYAGGSVEVKNSQIVTYNEEE